MDIAEYCSDRDSRRCIYRQLFIRVPQDLTRSRPPVAGRIFRARVEKQAESDTGAVLMTRLDQIDTILGDEKADGQGLVWMSTLLGAQV